MSFKHELAQTTIEFPVDTRAIATTVGKHPTRVYKWAIGKDNREEQCGIIPARNQLKLLNYCREK